MAAKTDLTWAEMSAQLPAGSITFDTDDILISAKALTGDTFTSINNEGILEFLYKFRVACNLAQTAANAALPALERLTSFPNSSFSPPVNGFVQVTQSHTVQLVVDPSQVKGTNG